MGTVTPILEGAVKVAARDPARDAAAKMFRETVEEVLGPTLDAYRDIRNAANDELVDDAALGRLVRRIIRGSNLSRVE